MKEPVVESNSHAPVSLLGLVAAVNSLDWSYFFDRNHCCYWSFTLTTWLMDSLSVNASNFSVTQKMLNPIRSGRGGGLFWPPWISALEPFLRLGWFTILERYKRGPRIQKVRCIASKLKKWQSFENSDLKSDLLENCHWCSHLVSKFWVGWVQIGRHFEKDNPILLKQVSIEA